MSMLQLGILMLAAIILIIVAYKWLRNPLRMCKRVVGHYKEAKYLFYKEEEAALADIEEFVATKLKIWHILLGFGQLYRRITNKPVAFRAQGVSVLEETMEQGLMSLSVAVPVLEEFITSAPLQRGTGLYSILALRGDALMPTKLVAEESEEESEEDQFTLPIIEQYLRPLGTVESLYDYEELEVLNQLLYLPALLEPEALEIQLTKVQENEAIDFQAQVRNDILLLEKGRERLQKVRELVKLTNVKLQQLETTFLEAEEALNIGGYGKQESIDYTQIDNKAINNCIVIGNVMLELGRQSFIVPTNVGVMFNHEAIHKIIDQAMKLIPVRLLIAKK